MSKRKDIYNLFDILKSKGRYGDTELAHITKDEANLLESRGGAGTINPKTGLKEYHGSAFWPGEKPYGHPAHHWNWAQDLYKESVDFYEDLLPEADWVADDISPTADIVTGMESRDEDEIWYDNHYEGDGHYHPGTWHPDGTYTEVPYDPSAVTPSKEIKYEEISKYVNQETGDITDMKGLIDYYRTINPDSSMLKGDYPEIEARIKKGPSLISDAGTRQDIYSGFETGVSDLRKTLKEEKLKAKSLAGTTGVTSPGMLGFGGVDKTISKGFYQDYSGLSSKYQSDIYGLSGDVEKDVADFLFPT